MKIYKSSLQNGKPIPFAEDIVFNNSNFDSILMRDVKKCHVVAIATIYDDLVKVDVDINCVVISGCAYTLEDVEVPLRIKDELIFSDDENDSENYYEPRNCIVLDSYILGIIVANIPNKVIKKGAIFPQDGDDYVVSNDEEVDDKKNNNP